MGDTAAVPTSLEGPVNSILRLKEPLGWLVPCVKGTP